MSEMVKLYIEDKLSITQIATRLNIPRSRVRKYLIENGVQMRTRDEGRRLRKDDIALSLRGKHRVFTDEHKKRISDARLAWGRDNARGFRITKTGYVEITRGPNKGKLQHRVIMEEILGRPLLKTEQVHHINRDRTDNRPCNLKLCTAKQHSLEHEGERRLTRFDIASLVCTGESSPRAKLTNKQAQEIRESSLRVCELMKLYGVSRSTIKKIRSNKTYKNEC